MAAEIVRLIQFQQALNANTGLIERQELWRVEYAGGSVEFDHEPSAEEIEASRPALDSRLGAIEARLEKLDTIESKVSAIESRGVR